MSTTNDAASKTEEPTPRKLQQAREKGEVVKTQDLASLASMGAAAAVVILGGGALSPNLMAALTPFLSSPDSVDFANGGGMQVFRAGVMAVAPFMGSVILAACI